VGANMLINRLLILSLLSFVLFGCAGIQPVTDRNSQLTQGNVQLNLKVGETTKAEVIEVFGAPNVTTRDGEGREVWTYQRSAQVAQSSSKEGYWTIILAGGVGRSSGMESSSRMITLIIKFNGDDIVTDFNSRTSNF
jgi:outer membrane protein assembly factor BamE (lipoprotein component of BamABCDE complex)